VGDGGSRELEAAAALGMQAVQATWYRREGFDKYQAAIRPEFSQIPEPMQLPEELF
jgi:FMN phosphatase YigB (HAD superfamily)